jgi:hypothetical protein
VPAPRPAALAEPVAARTVTDDHDGDFAHASPADATLFGDALAAREAAMSTPAEAVSEITRNDAKTPRPRAVVVDDDPELAAFEDALASAMLETGRSAAAPPHPDDDDDDDDKEEDDDDAEPLAPEDLEQTLLGEDELSPDDATHDSPELAAQLDAHLAAAEAEAEEEFAAGAMQDPFGTTTLGDEPLENEFGEEEISDFDVLAEADAADADLLSADGEADASDGSLPPVPEFEPALAPPAHLARPASNFAPQLDLDEDDDPAAEFEERHVAYTDLGRPREVAYDPPSGGYTLAESLRSDALEFDEPHGYARPHVPPPRNDSELESALESLDVDLDDLAARERSRPGLPGLPVHRVTDPAKPARPRRVATEDDGVLIDFDDDE